MKYKTLIFMLSTVSAVGLSGCGGSSNSDTTIPTLEPVATDTTSPVIDLNGNSTISVLL